MTDMTERFCGKIPARAFADHTLLTIKCDSKQNDKMTRMIDMTEMTKMTKLFFSVGKSGACPCTSGTAGTAARLAAAAQLLAKRRMRRNASRNF